MSAVYGLYFAIRVNSASFSPCAPTRTRSRRQKGACPPGPQHPGTTSLVTPVADKGEGVGEEGAEDGWREVRSNGEERFELR